MATGRVILLPGTVVSTDAGGFGFVPASAFDSDVTTLAYQSAASSYIGLDLGAGNTRRAYSVRFAPRPSTNDAAVYEQYVWGTTVSGSNTSATTGLATLLAIPASDNRFPRRACLNEYTLSGSTAYRWFRFANSNNCQLNECQIIVDPASGTGTINSMPLEPTITPGGGRYAANQNVTVTLASRTTSATIMYTTDGTTPAHSGGTPSGTTKIYTAPFVVGPTVAGVTIKALAYDSSCSTTNSMVATSAPFIIQSFTPNVRWYQVGDEMGFSQAVRTVEAHAPHIVTPAESGDGYYYMFGHFADATNTGYNPGPLAIWMYRSTDCINWTYIGQAVDGEGYEIGTGSFIVRPHVAYRPSTGKWVLWCKMGAATSYAAIWTADNVYGPWTLYAKDLAPLNSPRAYDGLGDFSFFKDDDGSVYVIASVTVGATFYFAVQKMADDGKGCTGTGVEFGQSNREGCVMWKAGGNYFAIHSTTNYYDPASTFDVRYTVGTGGTTPLNATWSALNGTLLFGADMTGTDYNAQPSCMVRMPGVGPVLVMDYWNQGENFLSNQVWVPLTFSGTSVVAVQGAWFPDTAATGAAQSTTYPGRRQAIAQHNARLAGGRRR